jgi:hypothetical protein
MTRIELQVHEPSGQSHRQAPLSRGIPIPAGALTNERQVRVVDGNGQDLPVQARVLLRHPDGSVSWLLLDTQADLAPHATSSLTLLLDEGEAPRPSDSLWVDEDEDEFAVTTGPLRFRVSKRAYSLVKSVELGSTPSPGQFSPTRALVPTGCGGDAWVTLRECFAAGEGLRRIYGLGGDCKASLAPDAYRLTLEESGPLRCVLRCDARLEADIPVGHYAGYRPFHAVTRIEAYAGHTHLRVLHTVVVACNPRETEVSEIGLRIPFHAQGPASARIAMRRELGGPLRRGESWLVSQVSDRHCVATRRVGERSRVEAEDERGQGWVAVEDGGAGLAVGMRWMAEEYPRALGVSPDGSAIEACLWRDPNGGSLSFARGSEEVRWGQGEGIYSDGTGSAKTSELLLYFYQPDEEGPGPRMRSLLEPPHLAAAPVRHEARRREEFANPNASSVAAPGSFPLAGRLLDGYADWMLRHQRVGRWYGYLDFGDLRATWEAEAGDWRFHGRWGWCNSEWDPRYGFWEQYSRVADGRLFALAEAFTRHSTDVDTCHYHPFRPYMVGGCYRHSVDHFGDEPCASHTFPDNWLFHYQLTGDHRTREVLLEASEFFYRFRWSEDPRFSFSLRSAGNTLRGLVIAWELTGEQRFLRRAEALFEAVARGQNPDGSWNKRFQVSTADRLPDQRPYGMATEGTTWAVEMGTAPPFTEAEFRDLWGDRWKGDRVLPDSEQRGYQTHYLMIGLERLHRASGRADLRAAYLRAVDWFCGGAERMSLDAALPHAGCGILCRHLAYAYRLSGSRQYLEIGRGILRDLIQRQNWSDDPRFRGALGMSPTDLSYCFFGVPALLAALADAGMTE